jgi:hypothetical protein
MKHAKSSGIFFWVWTLIALGATAMASTVLSAHGLWRGTKEVRSAPARV